MTNLKENHEDIIAWLSRKNKNGRNLKLNNNNLPSITIPYGFDLHEISQRTGIQEDIKKLIIPIENKIKENNFPKEIIPEIKRTLFEAYITTESFYPQKIQVGNKLQNNSLEIIVADTRDSLDILSNNISLYNIMADIILSNNQREIPFDNIKYFKSKDTGGLAVYLQKTNYQNLQEEPLKN